MAIKQLHLPNFRQTMLGAVLPKAVVLALYARASHKKNYRKLTSAYRKVKSA